MHATHPSTSFIVWLTGLPGAGKSTLARRLAEHLSPFLQADVLDGDEIRGRFWPELGFTKEARDTSVIRMGHLAQLLARNRVAAIVAVVSPYAATRRLVRRQADERGIPFIEVFVQAALDVLIQRDPKGMYRRALGGELKQFTGISDPYEPPELPEAVAHTDLQSIEESLDQILQALVERDLVPPAIRSRAGITPAI